MFLGVGAIQKTVRRMTMPWRDLLDTQLSEDTMSTHTNDGTEEGEEAEGKSEAEAEKVRVIVTHPFLEDEGDEASKRESVGDEDYAMTMDSLLETGWYTDPRVNSSFSSLSSNSLNALEESIKAAIGGLGHMDMSLEEKHSSGASSLDVHHPYLLEVPERLDERSSSNKLRRTSDLTYDNHLGLCFSELSKMSDSLPSPPAASAMLWVRMMRMMKEETVEKTVAFPPCQRNLRLC